MSSSSNIRVTQSVGTSSPDTVLYYAPVGKGGLSDYAVHQVAALSDSGATIVCLGSTHLLEVFAAKCPNVEYLSLPEPSTRLRRFGRLGRILSSLLHFVGCTHRLSALIRKRRFRKVLFASFAEYWSPFWVWPLRRLQGKGVRFGVVIHDPIRDFQVGPRWWHRWSVSLAYSFVEIGFTHEATELDTGWPKRQFTTVQIPHGLYEFPAPQCSLPQDEVRKQLGVPPDAMVLLSFGHIRDGKNLDLVIRALVDLPDCVLIVAGRPQSSTQRSVIYYQELAQQNGVADRCYWYTEFIPDDDVWKYFVASDLVLLTYSAKFRSASGVLNVAASFNKPVLASSGDGPLKQILKEYRLGLWCEPDSLHKLQESLRAFVQSRSDDLEWGRYSQDHSWMKNAETVLQHLQ